MTTLNTTTLAQLQISQVIEQLNQDDSLLLQAYSEYARGNGYDSVYDNDEDNISMLFANSYDAIRAAFYGDYNPSHAYFTFDGYGNLQSFEYLDSDNSPIDIEELAQWIVDNEMYNDYDLEVTTIDDMYNTVLDYVNNINSVSNIQSLLSYLGIDYLYTKEWLELSKNNTVDNYIENYINIIIADSIDNDDNDQLEELLEYFNH